MISSFARFRSQLPTAVVVALLAAPSLAEDAHFARAAALLERYCLDCHGKESPEAGVSLHALTRPGSFAYSFRTWQRAAEQIEQGRMPPEDAEQPSDEQRSRLLEVIRSGVAAAAKRHQGEPGRVVIRRLTSAEYEHTINDLTGLDLNLRRGFVDDAVGGTGFTNTAGGQFVQDSTLEHYLKTAERVARHAVIGAGPLAFHADPGRTGFELSAITRIQAIYRRHGFRSAAGEGGEAFGLDKYPRAMFVAWLYKHRAALDRPDVPLAALAKEQGVDVRFAGYIHKLMNSREPSFPTSEIVRHWKQLPAPTSADRQQLADARARCDQIGKLLQQWQRRFGANADAKEEAPVLRHDLFDVTRRQAFEMNVNWPEGTRIANLVVTVESATGDREPDAVVVWREPQIQFRIEDKRRKDPEPLIEHVAQRTAARLKFGRHPRGGQAGPHDFVTAGVQPLKFQLPVPKGARSARLLVTAELDTKTGESCIVRCKIAQLEETDQGKSVSALLADPEGESFADWRSGVLDFARALPQVSHREPAPSDRDPIPAPFDSSYNNPERNDYHTRIKYHRDDAFLVRNILGDEDRRRLDHAWADLLGSFEFHDLWLQFVAKKFGVQLGDRAVDSLDESWVQSLPDEPRKHVLRLQQEHQAIQRAFAAAEPGHVEDVLQLAARAWRRPLDDDERLRFRGYYRKLRDELGQTHRGAIRALIARVLVAPEFVYRAERTADDEQTPLSDWELASRLSYFLWSSPPDDELRRAAAAGELADAEQLTRQAVRMLHDRKSKRFAAEFFGQWFGFYRFDEHRGIDTARFPEFTESLRAAMHDEAVEFFDYIVRKDRPVREILLADYAFLNRELARHYGIDVELPGSKMQKIEKAGRHHRGGLLRLGAVLAVTSAPLRTSPVKRGDWILRRTLGTGVPPPPADAGSIAADDAPADGLSVKQRLAAHRREASCLNCHSRIDPLGFALEHYGPLGRWRDTYRDGQRIDASGRLRSGAKIEGDDGLHRYLDSQRGQFYNTLSSRLLGYSLGRSEQVGDLALLDRMRRHLEADGGFAGLVQLIVASRQFRYHGGNGAAAPDSASDPP